MMLEVSAVHRAGNFKLDVDFASRGPVTALFGPSGCGKTTTINIIAGLVRPKSVRVVCNGEILADTEKGIWVAAHQRRMGYVFQDARLLPHLSVRQNLRYGRWFTTPKHRFVDEDNVIDVLGLASLLDRRPKMLSGGEKQRVALGRALLQSPRLLLLDEPLASLDDARKAEIMVYIERLRDNFRVPIVYVSHDRAEVDRLATDVIEMRDGRIVASSAGHTHAL